MRGRWELARLLLVDTQRSMRISEELRTDNF
jgi:hypothetical protein